MDYEQSDNSLACESGYVAGITINDEEVTSVCVPTPEIMNKLGPDYKCQSS